MRLRVEVPATVANLGPGFDSFGLALGLRNVVEVDTAAPPSVIWSGEGADELPTDGSDLVSRAIREAAGSSMPDLAMRGENAIPLERGLGSSAAAAVAGALLGQALAGCEPSLADAFALASRLDGHPDNAAAAAFGGFTVVVDGAVVRRDPHPALDPLVLIPLHERVATAAARRALPASLPVAEVVAVASRAAAVALAMTDDPALLIHALRADFHEGPRLALVPAVRSIAEELRTAGVPVCVAGSGPTLIAFPARGDRVALPERGWRVVRPGVSARGAVLTRIGT